MGATPLNTQLKAHCMKDLTGDAKKMLVIIFGHFIFAAL